MKHVNQVNELTFGTRIQVEPSICHLDTWIGKRHFELIRHLTDTCKVIRFIKTTFVLLTLTEFNYCYRNRWRLEEYVYSETERRF